ncbi:PREDICTED: carcinoembryonic antigen-related cell adhesion molecule 18 [Chrysochloris asiatica]|uniref:Carcinoembryonic antigen-related cell adhesion molecule 18 n=1 Tax=Chrysochloris asiatica TaxID=185453 RepID=A0A9B0WTN9_CHRAS|nr:PREDICTED: carcinoembryonic antigen-related cell adhesion molecule 18 [Chrysochloris asiatica]
MVAMYDKLDCELLNVLQYSWYRSEDNQTENMIVNYKPPSKSWQVGTAFTGRENVTSNGHLTINNVALNDTGKYIVTVETVGETQRATGRLKVIELESEPTISMNSSSLVENVDSVAIFCHTNATKITWHNVSTSVLSSNDRMTISQDGKTLIIHMVDRDDLIFYCSAETYPGLVQRSIAIWLIVYYGPDGMTLKTEPFAYRDVISAEIGSKVDMECSASFSHPQTTYRWFHNDSLMTFSDAKMVFTSLSWYQLGRYRCVAENPVTRLILYKDVKIQLPCECFLPAKPWVDVPRVFTISGTMAVMLIVVTALGGLYLCGILIYLLISHCSTRCLLS